MRTIRAADLFCGAGGTSTGLRMACNKLGYELDLFAVNHWDIAIATHSTNHPDARHMCASIDAVDPRKAIPGGRLDLLWASPECTFFSVARGGKPVTDQGRASAWLILRWAELLYIDTILIENVKEFRDWCPVGVNGRPMKSRHCIRSVDGRVAFLRSTPTLDAWSGRSPFSIAKNFAMISASGSRSFGVLRATGGSCTTGNIRSDFCTTGHGCQKRSGISTSCIAFIVARTLVRRI